MDESLCDDFFFPAFILKLPPKPDFNGRQEHEDDFLGNTEGWSVSHLPEDILE